MKAICVASCFQQFSLIHEDAATSATIKFWIAWIITIGTSEPKRMYTIEITTEFRNTGTSNPISPCNAEKINEVINIEAGTPVLEAISLSKNPLKNIYAILFNF